MQKLKIYSYIVMISLLLFTVTLVNNDKIIDIYSMSIIDKHNIQFEEKCETFRRYEETNNKLKNEYANATEEEKLEFVVTHIIDINMTDYEKIKTLHDYLISILDYDYEAVVNNQVRSSDNQPGVVLITNRAVCAGYSYTFKALCDILGIPCSTILGNIEQGDNYIKHAWNQVMIDNEWYNIDVTFDDPWNDTKSNMIVYTYFLVSDSILDKRFDVYAYDGELHECTSTLFEYDRDMPIDVSIYN